MRWRSVCEAAHRITTKIDPHPGQRNCDSGLPAISELHCGLKNRGELVRLVDHHVVAAIDLMDLPSRVSCIAIGDGLEKRLLTLRHTDK